MFKRVIHSILYSDLFYKLLIKKDIFTPMLNKASKDVASATKNLFNDDPLLSDFLNNKNNSCIKNIYLLYFDSDDFILSPLNIYIILFTNLYSYLYLKDKKIEDYQQIDNLIDLSYSYYKTITRRLRTDQEFRKMAVKHGKNPCFKSPEEFTNDNDLMINPLNNKRNLFYRYFELYKDKNFIQKISIFDTKSKERITTITCDPGDILRGFFLSGFAYQRNEQMKLEFFTVYNDRELFNGPKGKKYFLR